MNPWPIILILLGMVLLQVGGTVIVVGAIVKARADILRAVDEAKEGG